MDIKMCTKQLPNTFDIRKNQAHERIDKDMAIPKVVDQGESILGSDRIFIAAKRLLDLDQNA